MILAEAVARPTLGPRSLLRHLKARGVDRSASGVAKVLRRHNLGTARQRVAALASLTAADTGQVTDAATGGAVRVLPVRLHPRCRWSPWTPSTSAGSRAWARSGSSPRSTSRPGSRSSSWSSGTRPPPSPPASSTT